MYRWSRFVQHSHTLMPVDRQGYGLASLRDMKERSGAFKTIVLFGRIMKMERAQRGRDLYEPKHARGG